MILGENKKAYFDYEILERFEAGIVLKGKEVKSLKTHRTNLEGAFVVIKDGEAFIINWYIPPYQPANKTGEVNSERTRKLLLKKKEINYLLGKTKEKGLTLVPLKVYTTNTGKIKLEIGLAKGRKKKDKREIIKKRESEREIGRYLKQINR